MKNSPTAPLASLPETTPNPGLPTPPRSIPTHPATCRPEPPARTRLGTLAGLVLALLLLATLLLAPTAQAKIYKFVGNDLVTVDLASGATTVIGNTGLTLPSEIWSLDFSPDGRLYGIDHDSATLYEFDIHTGAATVVRTIPGILGSALAISPDGVFYALDWGNTLVTFDPLDPVVPPVMIGFLGPAGHNLGDLDFAPDGTLYGLSQYELVTVDLATGDSTPVGPLGLDIIGDLDLSFSCNPDGESLLASALVLSVNPATGLPYGPSLLSIDTATGAAEVILSPLPGTSSAMACSCDNPAGGGDAVVYEPFSYPAGGLNGQGGTSEIGLTGVWNANASAQVVAGSLPYGTLPIAGGSIGNLSGGFNRYGGTRAVDSAALAGSGLLNDGATLWFSVVMGYGTGGTVTNARLAFALANSAFSGSNFQYYIANEGSQLGSGLGVTLGRFNGINGKVVATQFRDSSFGTFGFVGNVFGDVPGTTIGASQHRLVVGKITWGASSDIIELYEPDTGLNLGSPSSTLTVNVDQSTFDAITWSRGDIVTMDEIRFGASYKSVLGGITPPDNPVPNITSQPVSATVCEGHPALFVVMAGGADPLRYQWRKGGVDIAGANASTLSVDTVMFDDAGTYTVVVSNDWGSVTSLPAILTVVAAGPDILQHPSNIDACAGDNVQFTVVAATHMGGALGYQWRRDGNPIAGATGAALALPGVTVSDNGAQFDCVVTEVGCGSTTTNPALLTVDDSPPLVTPEGLLLTRYLEFGDPYVEFGATAWDHCDGDLTAAVQIGGDVVDPFVTGVYMVSYTVQDSHGNLAVAYRQIEVRDSTPPTFTQVPDDLVLPCGTDAEVAIAIWLTETTASDASGIADLSSSVAWSGVCGTTQAVVTWTATDVNGLSTSVARTITIVPDGMLTGVVFADAEIDRVVPANGLHPIPVAVINSSDCPSEIASATIVSSTSSPAFSVIGSTLPAVLCPGGSLTLLLQVDTVGALEGSYDATLVLTGRDGATRSLPISIEVNGRLLPDLSANHSGGGIAVIPDGGPGIPTAGEGLTLTVPIRNVGTAAVGAFKVNFFEGGNPLGSVEIPGLAVAGESAATLPLPGGLADGFYLIRVEVVPPNGGELRYGNNSASTVLQVGTSSSGSAQILVTAGLNPNCGLTSGNLSIHAEYLILSTTTATGPGGTTTEITRLTYPVQGGLIQAHILDTTIGLSSAHTDVNGNFTTTLPLPEAGTYELVVEVTDRTLTGMESFVVRTPEIDPCQPGGVPNQQGAPHPISLALAEQVDLYLCSDDIAFLDEAEQALSLPATPGQSIQVCATVHYYTSAGAALANQPVRFVARRQFEGEIEVRQIGTGLAHFDGGGPHQVCIPWTVPDEGTWTILVQLDPGPNQWTGNDEATRALTSSNSPQPATTLQVAASGAGCNALYQWVSGRALYVSPGTDPLPVKCGEVTVTAYDASGNLIGSRNDIHTDLAGIISANPYLGLPLGVNRMVVEVTDGTLTGTAEFTIECVGETNSPGPDTPPGEAGDLYVYSEDIIFLAADCMSGLSRNPLPNEPIAIAAELHYWDADGVTPLAALPVDVNVLVPLNGSLVTVPVAQTTVDFPDGGGSQILCVPWTPASGGPQIVQVVINPEGVPLPFAEYTGNNAATRLIFVGEVDCLLTATTVDGEVIRGESASYHVRGEALNSRTPTLELFLIDDTGGLPEGVSFSFGTSALTFSGETTLTVHTTAATPPGTYTLTVVGAGDGCVAMDQVELVVIGDITPPEIVLTGGDSLTLECGQEFVDPGWTASDDTDGDVQGDVEVSGTVDAGVPGTYTLTYTVTDAAGNVATVVRTVTVVDIAPPAVTITAPESGYLSPVSTLIDFAGTLHDCSAITSAKWLFTSGGISEDPLPGTVSGNAVNNAFAFTEPGVYAIRLEATDAEGNTGSADTVLNQLPAYVVIYDPNGGFVTGGGWVWSPPGALYPGQPVFEEIEGKASFGFVSKYKKGATTPTGQTEFQFRAGDLNFHSSSYDWLVVAGARAQFKGKGTVNGEEGYGFLLTGVDGQSVGGGGLDRFRIKIWDELSGFIVYDNQPAGDDASLNDQTILWGGQIVIHK